MSQMIQTVKAAPVLPALPAGGGKAPTDSDFMAVLLGIPVSAGSGEAPMAAPECLLTEEADPLVKEEETENGDGKTPREGLSDFIAVCLPPVAPATEIEGQENLESQAETLPPAAEPVVGAAGETASTAGPMSGNTVGSIAGGKGETLVQTSPQDAAPSPPLEMAGTPSANAVKEAGTVAVPDGGNMENRAAVSKAVETTATVLPGTRETVIRSAAADSGALGPVAGDDTGGEPAVLSRSSADLLLPEMGTKAAKENVAGTKPAVNASPQPMAERLPWPAMATRVLPTEIAVPVSTAAAQGAYRVDGQQSGGLVSLPIPAAAADTASSGSFVLAAMPVSEEGNVNAARTNNGPPVDLLSIGVKSRVETASLPESETGTAGNNQQQAAANPGRAKTDGTVGEIKQLQTSVTAADTATSQNNEAGGAAFLAKAGEMVPVSKTAAAPEPAVTQAEARAVQQLAENIGTKLREGVSDFKMKLYPAGLGEVSVHLTWREGKLSVDIVAAAAGTQRLLENQSPDLRTALEAKSYEVANLDVRCNHDGSQNDFAQRRQQEDAKSIWHHPSGGLAAEIPLDDEWEPLRYTGRLYCRA